MNGYKMKGKGYEYDDWERKFVLEINNNGRGKEYYKDNKIQFEGEYFNGKRWNGNVYDKDCNKISSIRYGKGFVKKYDYYGNLEFYGDI